AVLPDLKAPPQRSLVSLDDPDEIRSLEACPADQRAIHIGDRHEFCRVGGLHRSAVKNAHLGIGLLADRLMHLSDLVRGWRESGANGPYRLVSNDRVRRSRAHWNRALELARGHVERMASFALFEAFADANDRDELGPVRGFSLAPDDLISLAM